jgi:hypothetical protein
MKISVLIPSEEFRTYAGARIRYGRIKPFLEENGHEFTLEDVSSFDLAAANCDVLIISKNHDARSLVIAADLSNRGCVVGLDLFDDYYSQVHDSRLVRFRTWLAQAVEICDFALCSTSAMVRVVHGYRPELVTHVMNDAAADDRLRVMPDILARKLRDARDRRQLKLCWFGNGDNPHFPVGLSDLASFGGMLGEIMQAGLDVELTVLTNTRALGPEGLTSVMQLPVRTVLEEWSEERETELLLESTACFLPVNAQNFSIAKSLNRAISALTSGCQVISAGYPLYDPLNKLIYRDIATFLYDLHVGELKFSEQRLDIYRLMLEQCASAEKEATSLASFLCGRQNARKDVGNPSRVIALVHGLSTHSAAHKLVQTAGGFSIASPYCSAKLDFDAIMKGTPGADMTFLSPNQTHAQLRPRIPAIRRLFEKLLFKRRGTNNAEWGVAPPSYQLATYSFVMGCIKKEIDSTFGECHVFFSETSPLPFTPEI